MRKTIGAKFLFAIERRWFTDFHGGPVFYHKGPHLFGREWWTKPRPVETWGKHHLGEG